MAPRTTPTTTLKVRQPEDYTILENTYQLIRYELPPDLRGRLKNASYLYGQMHNILRDQLDCPYKAYLYDQIDPNTTKWVVYALYLHGESPKILEMPLSSRTPSLTPQPIAFKQLPLHMLLKLLEITYVRGHKATRFVGQDSCYIHAKKVGEFSHICLRIDLKGDIQAQQTDMEQKIKVNGRACLFRRVDYSKAGSTPSYTYFGRKITGKRVHFLHLKRSEIEAAKLRNEPVYGIGTRDGKRTTLAYHNLGRIEESTGKLLADFIHDFVTFLAQYGIHCQSQERQFNRFTPPKQDMQLPLTLLKTVEVYDHRFNHSHPLEEYLQIFRKLLPEVEFVELTDISLWKKHAVLVLQDYTRNDFEDGKPLDGRTDPYDDLYSATPHIPKQSMNVNIAGEDDMEEDDDDIDDDDDDDDMEENDGGDEIDDSLHKEGLSYLSYNLPASDDKNFKLKLSVALNQLYLKEAICLKRSVQQWLPYAPKEFLFVRKARTIPGHDPYETAIFFENDTITFLDLRDPDQKARMREVCAQRGVSWVDMEDQLLRKYKKRTEGEADQELAHYDLIIGSGLFVELEDAEERVLYDYEKIVERQEAKKKNIRTQDFKLLPYYDIIRPRALLALKDVRPLLTLTEGELSQLGETEIASRRLYYQLEAYDDFLDDVAQSDPTISFNNLTKGEFMEHIAYIFQKGKNSRRQLKAYYKKRNLFLSDKGQDVHMYEGIWYDEEHHYMVGSPTPLNQQQPRAHLIRHFDVYVGEHFDIEPFLLAMSVQFVRYNQYTVYPYPFHLIDLYVENVLRYL